MLFHRGFRLGNCCKKLINRKTIYDSNGVRKSVLEQELQDYLNKGWITAEENRKIQQQKNKILKQQKKLIKQQKLQQERKRKLQLKQKQKNNKPKKVGWNKGLTKYTDDRVRKIAQSKIGNHKYQPPHSQQTKRKISQSNKNKKWSDETRQKYNQMLKNRTEEKWETIKKHMSQSHIGKKQSQQIIRKKVQSFKKTISNPNYKRKTKVSPTKGKIHITNGVVNKYILPQELPKYQELGYYRGGLIKNKKS